MKREFKGTPGPWKAKNIIGLSRVGNLPRIENETGSRIAETGWGNVEMVEANANLIAAAPELLEALEGLLDESPASVLHFHESIEKAEKAVAKAYGESEEK